MSEKNVTHVLQRKRDQRHRSAFFDNNGYLVLENFLAVLMSSKKICTIAQRPRKKRFRMLAGEGEKSARIFYILDDDPLFLS